MLSCDWYYRKGIKPITENCRAGDSGSGKGWAYKKGTEVAWKRRKKQSFVYADRQQLEDTPPRDQFVFLVAYGIWQYDIWREGITWRNIIIREKIRQLSIKKEGECEVNAYQFLVNIKQLRVRKIFPNKTICGIIKSNAMWTKRVLRWINILDSNLLL